MQTYSEQRTLPYSAGQMFDLAADIERYPEFLPGWEEVSVLERTADAVRVSQRVGLGPVRARLVSRALFEPPTRIRIRAESGPFRRLEIEWRFRDLGAGQCRISLEVALEARPRAVEKLLARLAGEAHARVLEAFARRAEGLYSPAPPASSGRPG